MPVLSPGNLTTGLGAHTYARKSQGGVTLKLAANQAIPTGTDTDTALNFHATPVWDPGGLWVSGAGTTFTIPSGWTHIKVLGSAFWTHHATGARQARVLVNDVHDPLYGGSMMEGPFSTSNSRTTAVSGIIAVSENDEIKFAVNHNRGANLNVETNAQTSFTILKWNTTAYTHIKLATTQEIPTGVSTTVLYDELVFDGLGIFDADNAHILDMDKAAMKAAGRRYQCYGGVELETALNGNMMARFEGNLGAGNTHSHHAREEYEVVTADNNFGCVMTMFTPPAPIPSVDLPLETGITFATKHDHGSDRTALAGFLQIEDAQHAFNAIITNSSNQTVSPSSTELFENNVESLSLDPDFHTGAGSQYLKVPAHPTGGTWLFAIATAGMAWDTTDGRERQSWIQADQAGYASTHGLLTALHRIDTFDRFHHQAYLFLPLPVADDEFRGQLFQNEVGNRTMLSNVHQHFSLELFD